MRKAVSRNAGQIMEAQAQWHGARARLNALEHAARRDVVAAVTVLEVTAESVERYEGALNELSAQNLSDIVRAFEAGELGVIEVLRAQDDLSEITEGYHDAVLEHRVAVATLEAVVGTALRSSAHAAEEEK